MVKDMANDQVAALTVLAAQHNEAILELVARVQALTLTSAALMAALGDTVDRPAIRSAALSALGDSPANAQAALLIEALMREPASAVVEHQAEVSAGLAAMPSRLQ